MRMLREQFLAYGFVKGLERDRNASTSRNEYQPPTQYPSELLSFCIQFHILEEYIQKTFLQ